MGDRKREVFWFISVFIYKLMIWKREVLSNFCFSIYYRIYLQHHVVMWIFFVAPFWHCIKYCTPPLQEDCHTSICCLLQQLNHHIRLSTYPFVATISALSDDTVCVRIRIFPLTSSDCAGSVIQIQNRQLDLMVKSSS